MGVTVLGEFLFADVAQNIDGRHAEHVRADLDHRRVRHEMDERMGEYRVGAGRVDGRLGIHADRFRLVEGRHEDQVGVEFDTGRRCQGESVDEGGFEGIRVVLCMGGGIVCV